MCLDRLLLDETRDIKAIKAKELGEAWCQNQKKVLVRYLWKDSWIICNIIYLLDNYLGQGVSNASADFKRRPIDIHDQSSMISTIYQSRFPVILLTFGKGWSVYHSKSYERFLPLLKLPKYHRHWIHFHNQSRGTCKNIFTM